MNINNPTTFSTPALTLSTSNSSGTSGALRADDTLLVYDTTAPANVTLGSAVVGTASTAARRDHVHSTESAIGDVDGPGSSVDNNIVRYSGTTGKLIQSYTSGGPTISDTGQVLFPGQPSFLAFLDTTQTDETGDATVAQVDFNAEIYDQTSNFASSTFTAPITGKYLLTANIACDGRTTAATQIAIEITTSNRRYSRTEGVGAGTSGIGINMSTVADMDASDTAVAKCMVAGEGSKVIDFVGNGTILYSYFAGCLVV